MSLSYRRLLPLFAGTVAIVALTAGCDSTSADHAGMNMSVTSTPAPTTAAKSKSSAALSSPQAATKLCNAIRPELSNWRVQGPTLSKPGFNLLVQQWAMEAAGVGGGNVEVLRDKAVVDRATTSACPDVRDEALEALEVSDLAGALVGF